MALSRAAALRSCFRAIRPTAVRPQLCRHAVRRGYASAGGHGSTKAGGDAVWAAGAIAVTVPTCWYLLANGPEPTHGHDDHHDSHGESHDAEGEDEGKEGEEKSDADEGNSDDKESEQSDDSGSEDKGKDADTPVTSDDEGNEDVKKAAKDVDAGVNEKEGGEHKHVPDAKGGAKKRIDSNLAKKQGQEAKGRADGSGPEDAAATAKNAGDQDTTSGKQEGLSNTDTKHSTPIAERPDTPKKGEGTPETAKAKGTVDPKRPSG